MVTPTNPSPVDSPDPFEAKEDEVESQVPAEIVAESLPIPESEKELEDFDIIVIETPSDVETVTHEVATEALQMESPEEVTESEGSLIENNEIADLEPEEVEVEEKDIEINTDEPEIESPENEEEVEVEEKDPEIDTDEPQIESPENEDEVEVVEGESEEPLMEDHEIEEEIEKMSAASDLELEEVEDEEAEELEEEEAAGAEDIDDEEEEDLNLITNAISDDYADPNGQEFKKLLEEILPFDDTMQILPKEKSDDAAHFFDLEHKVFYTHKPLQQKDLSLYKHIFLQLNLTENEIRSIKITRVPLSSWEAFIHKLKNQN